MPSRPQQILEIEYYSQITFGLVNRMKRKSFLEKIGEEVLLNSNGKLTLNLSDEGSEEII